MIKKSFDKMKVLNDVQYVPHLAHNLLSVGQLMRYGYIVTFDEESCLMKDKETGVRIAEVPMARDHMFSLEVDQVG